MYISLCICMCFSSHSKKNIIWLINTHTRTHTRVKIKVGWKKKIGQKETKNKRNKSSQKKMIWSLTFLLIGKSEKHKSDGIYVSWKCTHTNNTCFYNEKEKESISKTKKEPWQNQRNQRRQVVCTTKIIIQPSTPAFPRSKLNRQINKT